jgi:hypothetical protein
MKHLLLLITLLTGFFAQATHFAGGDIYYDYIGKKPGDNTKDQYRITCVVYRDDINGVVIPTTAVKRFGVFNALTNAELSPTLNFSMPEKSRRIISQYAPNCPYPPGIRYEQIIYESILELPNNLTGNPGFYIGAYDFARNGAQIKNLVNGGATSFGMVWVTFIPPSTFKNSSPRFKALPVPYMCVGRKYVFNHDGFDPNGDSLVFSLVWPYGGYGQLGGNGATGAGIPNAAVPASLPATPALPGNANN